MSPLLPGPVRLDLGGSGGGAGLTVLSSLTLTGDAASFTLPAISPPLSADQPLIRVVSVFRVNTSPTGTFDRVRMQINGDTAIDHYAWQVLNTTGIGVGSQIGQGPPNSNSSASWMVSHATTNGDVANLFSGSVLTFLYPGDTTRMKIAHGEWAFTDGFTSQSQGPLGTTGGYSWVGTAAISTLTFFPQLGDHFVAGTSVTVWSG